MVLKRMKKYFKFILVLFVSLSISFAGNTKDIPSSFADLAERVMPSVVNISTTTTVTTQANPFPFQFPPGSPFEDMFKEFGTPQKRKSNALGSGFIIDEKGIVITNNHVIQSAEDIVVRVNGDKEFKAKVIGADPGMDIAVLQMETDEKFVPVNFGDSDKARIGDWVIAIGNPFGFGGTVTSGIISARNRSIGLSRYEDFIQTDASINQGNSGGPLFSNKGSVVGVNTLFEVEGQNLNFAIAVDHIKQFIKDNPNVKKVNPVGMAIRKDYPNAIAQDYNKNGVIDTWYVDDDKNGKIDTAFIDDDEDGFVEGTLIDKNENGVWEIELYDTDQDGKRDVVFIDEDEDKKRDVKAYDYDQDGEWDKFEKIS